MMQLINFSQISNQETVNTSLIDTLQDIAQKIEIYADFSIHHPHYQPLALAPNMVECFSQMPPETQKQYLSLQLRTYIYGIYYNGSLQSKLRLDQTPSNQRLDVENHAFSDIDADFHQQIDANNYGTGYFDANWQIIKQEADGNLVVTKKGLKLHIEPVKHLSQLQQNATVGDSVSIKMPKSLLTKGFYMAVGDAGANYGQNADIRPSMVRIYLNLTSGGAIALMKAISQALNEIAIPFSFKVLYNPGDYGRYDSGVLYFDKRDYATIRPIIQSIYSSHQQYFQPQVPLFTKYLAPGMGLAEEVERKLTNQESFGMHRCQLIANGLLLSWEQGNQLPEARMKLIIEQFSSMGIDTERTYLNPDSEDIYQF
ncbi:T3SS effector HopA1 family protein [Nostoc sp. CMAA1605]|uniref:T3SS effector HopA1 family protein n=1 Tax=Nostoc sp. CMAA1605 TaxID=2055159 RepID=UPI002E34F0F6|nr:T3SS effector HopA1 family protein [Nostoc sp. CMAA1605]